MVSTFKEKFYTNEKYTKNGNVIKDTKFMMEVSPEGIQGELSQDGVSTTFTSSPSLSPKMQTILEMSGTAKEPLLTRLKNLAKKRKSQKGIRKKRKTRGRKQSHKRKSRRKTTGRKKTQRRKRRYSV